MAAPRRPLRTFFLSCFFDRVHIATAQLVARWRARWRSLRGSEKLLFEYTLAPLHGIPNSFPFVSWTGNKNFITCNTPKH